MKNYTEKVKYFITRHIKLKIQLKISYKSSSNITQTYKKYTHRHKKIFENIYMNANKISLTT